MVRFFISYSRRDAEIRDELLSHLDLADLSYWVDKNNIALGENWRQEIQTALLECNYVLLLVSTHSKISLNVAEEIAIADTLLKSKMGQLKAILPVLLSGDNLLPFGLNQLNYYDLRQSESTLEGLVKELKARIRKNGGSITEGSDPKASEITFQALPYRAMLLLERLLAAAGDLITQDQAKGRASLLWFARPNRTYIAAATHQYSDQELRLKLTKGRGFAGRVWELEDRSPQLDYPRQMDAQTMERVWGFKEAEINHAHNMGSIISQPIWDQGRMVGILSLDHPTELETSIFEDLRPSLRLLSSEFAQLLKNTKPLSYLQYRRLQTLVFAARLALPFDKSCTASLYGLEKHGGEDSLYLINRAAEQESDAAMEDIRFTPGKGFVGQVLENGFLVQDWHKKSPQQIQADWGMTDYQYELFSSSKAILGLRIEKPSNDTNNDPPELLGVLILESSENLYQQFLSPRVHDFLSLLSQKAAEILAAKPI